MTRLAHHSSRLLLSSVILALFGYAAQCNGTPAVAADVNVAAKANYSDIYEKNIFDPQRQPWLEKPVVPPVPPVPPLNSGDIEVYGVMSVGSYKRAILKLSPGLKKLVPEPNARPFVVVAIGQAVGPYTLVEMSNKSIVMEGGGQRYPVTFAAKRDRTTSGPIAPAMQEPVILPPALPTSVPGIEPIAVAPIMPPQPEPAATPQQAGSQQQAQQQAAASAAVAAQPAAPETPPAPPIQGQTLLEAIQAAQQAGVKSGANPFTKRGMAYIMNISRYMGLALLILLSLMSLPLGAAEIRVPDEIIVKYKTLNRFADHGAIARRVNRHTEVVRVAGGHFQAARRSKWADIQEQIAAIKQDPNVLYAEPNYLGHFAETVPPPPNDPSYASQWWLPVVGDRALWALGRGNGVVVAVIDTGVDLSHPDLVPNLLSNGYNFGDGNAIPQDQLGHGTHVAGIIAAAQNNSQGVSGLAPAAKILPIKINPGALGTFTSDRLGSAIAYAVSQGAKIINLSLTVDQQTQTVQDALQAALNAGVTVVAAAGNLGGVVEFPATMPGVIGVAATDQSGKLAGYSNFGPEITIAAPGSSIYSIVLGGSYGPGADGTSFAAPIVSAALADVVSINPSLPASQFAAYLRSSAKAISGGAYPFGVLDAGATGNSLVPHLVLSKQQFSAQESFAMNFVLPPTGDAMNIYVAVQTPLGEYALHSDGSWTAVTPSGYVPIALGYRSGATLSGTLFGSGGVFGAISLAGLPTGAYTWRTALVNTVSGSVVGDVIVTPMILQ